MSKVLVTESHLEDIADAIREKTGSTDTYTPAEMAEAISDISGGVDLPTFTITFDENYEAVISVTCDKTFAECEAICDANGQCYAYFTTTNGTDEYNGMLFGYDLMPSSNMKFALLPNMDAYIYYANSGEIEFVVQTADYLDSITVTRNGVYEPADWDGKPFGRVTVTVPSGSSASVGTKTLTNSSATNTSISFTGLSGTPKAFFVRCTSQLTRSSSSSYYYVVSMRYNGTNTTGNYWRMSNGTFYNDTTHYSYTYSGGTLTVTSSASRTSAGGSFYNGGYELVYVY